MDVCRPALIFSTRKRGSLPNVAKQGLLKCREDLIRTPIEDGLEFTGCWLETERTGSSKTGGSLWPRSLEPNGAVTQDRWLGER